MGKKGRNFIPKIVNVKYLKLIDQIRLDSFLTLPQKCANFLDMHPVIQLSIKFCSHFYTSQDQTLKFRKMKFEQNCSYIGGVNAYLLKRFPLIFNLTVV